MNRQENSIAYAMMLGIILALSLFLCGCMGNAEEGSNVINDEIDVDSIDEIFEEQVRYTSCSQWSDNGFVSIVYDYDAEEWELIFYDFSSLRYREIPIKGINCNRYDIMPFIVNNRIYLVQNRMASQGGLVTVLHRDTDNIIFIYDVDKGIAETHTLPDKYYFSDYNMSINANGDKVKIAGAEEGDQEQIYNNTYIVDLNTFEVNKYEEEDITDGGNDHTYGSGYIGSYNNAEYYYWTEIKEGIRDQKGPPYGIEDYNQSVVKVEKGSAERETVAEDIYPGSYGQTVMGTASHFLMVDHYIFYFGFDSENNYAASFMLNIETDKTLILHEGIYDGLELSPFAYINGKILLTSVGRRIDVIQRLYPDEIVLVGFDDYISGEYEPSCFILEE